MDRLQGYKNVDHVLRVLSEMHEHLYVAISELSDQAHEDRTKMALGYLADHQSKRASALAAYRRDAEPTLLGQWFRVRFPEGPHDLIGSLCSKPADESALEDLISELDAFMDRLLQHLSNRAATRNARALFQDLLDIENRERHLRSRALGWTRRPVPGDSMSGNSMQ